MAYLLFSDLKEEVEIKNIFLVYSGSNVFFKACQRNGYKTVDLHYIGENGDDICHDCVEGGTSRECIQRLHIEASHHMGKCWHGYSVTRKTAKARLALHIDFDKAPAQIEQSELELLHTWAEMTNYQKPANYSRGYGFFLHLKNKVKL